MQLFVFYKIRRNFTLIFSYPVSSEFFFKGKRGIFKDLKKGWILKDDKKDGEGGKVFWKELKSFFHQKSKVVLGREVTRLSIHLNITKIIFDFEQHKFVQNILI